MRFIAALTVVLLAIAPAGAQQAGSWRVACTGGICTASSTAKDAAPIAMHVAPGPVVSFDGGNFNPQGVVIFAFNGMQTTFFPVASYLRDGGRRFTIGPNEVASEIVHQGSHAKRITVSLPLVSGERKVDFATDNFASAMSKVTGHS
jgi:hypothetical protein